MGPLTSKQGLTLRICGTALLAGALACGTTGPHAETVDPLPRPKSEAPAKSEARRVSKEAQLPKTSPMAEGRTGDFVLTNDRLAVVVRSLGMPGGGAIVDAAVKGRRDALGFLGVFVGQAPAQPPQYRRLHLDHETLRVWGVDAKEPDVVVETRYTLPKGSNVLLISTLVTNEGTRTLNNYRIEDNLQWAAATPYAPTVGILPRGQHQLPWLGAWSEETSYAYTAKGAPSFDVVIQPSQARVALAAGNLVPQQSLSAHRQLIIGSGHRLTTVVEELSRARGLPTGPLDVHLVDQEGEPLGDGIVDVLRDGKPVYSLQAPRDGRMALRLPQGNYVLIGKGKGRRGKPTAVKITAAASASLRLNLGPPSQLVFDVREEGSAKALSCGVSVIGVGDTPSPWFGPLHTLRAGHTVYSATGKGVLPVAPGRYRVIIGRGPYFSRLDKIVDLPPHSGKSVVARLKAVVAPKNGNAVDFDHRAIVMKPGEIDLLNRIEGLDQSIGRHVIDVDALIDNAGDDAGPMAALRTTERWLHGLAAGKVIAAVARSSRRNLLPLTTGYPRTHVLISPPAPRKKKRETDTGGKERRQPLGEAEVRAAVKEGRTVASNGPLLSATINGRHQPGDVVSLPRSAVGRRRKRSQPIRIELAIAVSAPAWMPLGNAVIYVNGKPWGAPLPLADSSENVRLDTKVSIPITRDSFVVVVVSGDGKQPRPWGYTAAAPYAATSPIWIDKDGNGIYDPGD